MNKLPLFTLCIGLTVFISCMNQSTSKLSTDQREAIVDSIKHIAGIFEDGINNLDLDSQFELFTDESDFTFSEDGHILPPKDSMRILFEPKYAKHSEMSFKWDTMRIVVLDKNSAVFTGHAKYSYTLKTGKSGYGHVVGTYAFSKRSGRWKLIHGHASHSQ